MAFKYFKIIAHNFFQENKIYELFFILANLMDDLIFI